MSGVRSRCAAIALSMVAISLTGSPAGAQVQQVPCPGIDQTAEPEEHAMCWYARNEGDHAGCAPESDDCLSRAATWCHSAALDAPQVAESCFLALLRTGDLGGAANLAEYLEDPSDEASRCRSALTDMVTGRVVSNPAGAQVTLDGQRYGAAPVEVQLSQPWWQRQITVEFGGRPVTVSEVQLRAAFDAQSCRMGDIVVADPGTGGYIMPPAVTPAYAAQDNVVITPDYNEPETGKGLRTFGWVLIGAGGAAGVAALVTGLMAESEYQHIDANCPTRPCGPEWNDTISRGSALATASTVTTFAAVGLGVAGLILVLTSGGDEEPETTASSGAPRVRMSAGPALLGAGAQVSF